MVLRRYFDSGGSLRQWNEASRRTELFGSALASMIGLSLAQPDRAQETWMNLFHIDGSIPCERHLFAGAGAAAAIA